MSCFAGRLWHGSLFDPGQGCKMESKASLGEHAQLGSGSRNGETEEGTIEA